MPERRHARATIPRPGFIAIAVLGLLVTTMSAPELRAAEIFVATWGDDRSAGTEGEPYRSIGTAVDRARPGDVVLVHPGVFTDVVVINSGGTQDAPVTVAPVIPGTVVIEGSDTEWDTSLVQIFGDHLIFEGFHVYNAKRVGITAWGTTGVVIRGNQVTGSTRSGIWVGHSDAGESRENTIEGNVVFSTSLVNRAREAESGWPVALHVSASDDSLIQSNRVFMNYGEGIGVLSSRGVRVENNISVDNFSVQIYLDNAPDTLVTGNTAATTGDECYFRRGQPGHGIVIANEYTDIPLASNGILVERNTLIGVGAPFYAEYGAGGGPGDSVIRDNTILDNRLEVSDWLNARAGSTRCESRPRSDRPPARRSARDESS